MYIGRRVEEQFKRESNDIKSIFIIISDNIFLQLQVQQLYLQLCHDETEHSVPSDVRIDGNSLR